MIIFLKIVDLPLETSPQVDRLGRYRPAFHRRCEAHRGPRSNLNAYLENLLDRRLAAPGQDLFSMAIHADIGGRRA